jgi:hypothetical protein
MKMKPEHYQHLVCEILAAAPKEAAAGHLEWLREQPNVGDLAMRFRWDLFYAAGLSSWACNNLYSYLHDSHIDTALQKLVKEHYQGE